MSAGRSSPGKRLNPFSMSRLLVFFVALSGRASWATQCPVAQAHAPAPAEQAYLAGNYEQAASMYRTELASHANDPALTVSLVRVLLRQQKVDEASTTITAAIAANPASTALLTAKAEVQYRKGTPWEVDDTLAQAMNLDSCLPRLHLTIARFARLKSGYLTAKEQIQIAHQLDPYDPDIREEWLWTLPLRERIAELESYLASPTGRDAEELRSGKLYLEHLKKALVEPHKACRLVSTTDSTEIPFRPIMGDATHLKAYGLDVQLNRYRARLEIDTGADGLVVSRSVASHAGLKPFSEAEVGGIGDEKQKASYSAYADSIHIGDLEFRDCMVEVVDNSRMSDQDGLIGMDIFSRFLVTLDFPEHRLQLGALPVRPGEGKVTPTLSADSTETEEAAQSDVTPAATNKPTAKPTDKEPPAAPNVDATAKAANKGPFNRYVAPEMKAYTAVYRRGHLLMLPVLLNRSKVKLFVMDTGAWTTSVSPEAGREVTKVHSDDSYRVFGLSGEVRKVYVTDQITFAFARVSQIIERVPAFDTSQISKHVGMEISGFVGAQTLKLTTIHIDYRDGLVKFDYDPKKVSALPAF